MGKIALVEVFRSVQGEGYNAGRAAVFVRLAGCNLACRFAEGAVCDTPYQRANLKVDIDALFAEYVVPLANAGERFNPYREDNVMLIITGGEPTLSPQFDLIASYGKQLGFYVAVETNGTRWRGGFADCDWISVSPKEAVAQGSHSPLHNPNPGSPKLDPDVVGFLENVEGEYRYVIDAEAAVPPLLPAFRHYVSPAIASDGSGEEWKTGFPGFAPGALQRCLDIVATNPRWRISLQSHKFMQVR